MSRVFQIVRFYHRPEFGRGLTACAKRRGYKATTKAIIVWRPNLP